MLALNSGYVIDETGHSIGFEVMRPVNELGKNKVGMGTLGPSFFSLLPSTINHFHN